MYVTTFTDGTRCTLQGAGDPNTNGAALAAGCTSGVYLNDAYNSRNPGHSTWVWDVATSTWVARA